MDGWTHDVRFAARSWLRRPGFAAAVVVTLGVGIGATTLLTGVVDRVVLRPLPYSDAEQLVQLGIRYPDWSGLGSVSPASYLRWREQLRGLEDVTASRLQSLTLDGPDGPVVADGAGVSGSFFQLFGGRAQRGRVFGLDGDRPGAPRVAVLTHRGWTRRFGADPGIVGRPVSLDRIPFTVVGILEPGFVPPESIRHDGVEIYFPLAHVADRIGPEVTNGFLQVAARLAPGTSLDAARAELAAAEEELLRELGADPAIREADAVLLYEQTVGDFGRVVLPFLGAVVILLLVACANVANLFLVRAAERAREMHLRRSLGATRGRLLRQLVTESLLLCGAAALLGGALAWGGTVLFRAMAPPSIPRLAEVAVDLRVLGIAASLGVLTGLLFGLVPGLHLLRGSAAAAARGRADHHERAGRRTRDGLVVAEVAVALVLFVGAALLGSSFVHLLETDLGIEPERVAYLKLFPKGERYESPVGRLAYWRTVTERVAALPGVSVAGATNNPPLDRNASTRNVTIEGYDGPNEGSVGGAGSGWAGTGGVSWHLVLPGFFETLGIQPVAGRRFTPSDDGRGTVAVVVNEAMVRAFWPGAARPADVLGARLHFGARDDPEPRWMEVVGVVEDVRQQGPARPPAPELYVPYAAAPTAGLTVVARTPGDPAALVRGMRAVAAEVDPGVPVTEAGRYEEIVRGTLRTPRFHATLLGVLAGTALLLALVGVYATMAYTVRQRRHELGVRMALGAPAGQLRGMVLGRGMALAATGIVVGLGLSLLGTRLLESMVYGVTPTDPAIFAGASVLLVLAAVGACWLPARRATRVDPMETLRAE